MVHVFPQTHRLRSHIRWNSHENTSVKSRRLNKGRATKWEWSDGTAGFGINLNRRRTDNVPRCNLRRPRREKTTKKRTKKKKKINKRPERPPNNGPVVGDRLRSHTIKKKKQIEVLQEELRQLVKPIYKVNCIASPSGPGARSSNKNDTSKVSEACLLYV